MPISVLLTRKSLVILKNSDISLSFADVASVSIRMSTVIYRPIGLWRGTGSTGERFCSS